MAEKRGAAARVWHEVVAVVGTVFAHDLTQLAAALTYYTVLSLLPALIVVVALLGIVGLSPDTVHSLLDTLGELGAPWAAEFVSDVLDSVLRSQNSGVVLLVSLAAALWAASAYVGSFMAASDRIYEISAAAAVLEEPAAAHRLALALLVLLSVTAAVDHPRRALRSLGEDATGIGTGPLHLWSWIKWPLLDRPGPVALHAAVQVHARAGASRPSGGCSPAPWQESPCGSPHPPASASTSTTSPRTTACTARSAPLVAFLVWAWLVNLALLVGVEVNRDVEQRRNGEPDAPTGRADASPEKPPGKAAASRDEAASV